MFAGNSPPFLTPLVGDTSISSGGRYSYVPLPFGKSIRITIVGRSVGFYNIDYHLFDPTTAVTSFTGNEDVSAAAAMWKAAGKDPKSDTGNIVAAGTTTVPAGQAQTILNVAGPRSISSIKMRLPDLAPASRVMVTDNGRALVATSEFRMAIHPGNTRVELQRRFDYGIANQRAEVSIDGVPAGIWDNNGSDTVDRWRDSVFQIPADKTTGKSFINVKIRFLSSSYDWNEFRYWTYSILGGQRLLSDTLDVANSVSEVAHSYGATGQTWTGEQTFSFVRDVPTLVEYGGLAHVGTSQFTMALAADNRGAVLQRTMDYWVADQSAKVYVDGSYVGTWTTKGSDTVNRWRDVAFLIPETFTQGKTSVQISIVFNSSSADWNEFRYKMLSRRDNVDTLSDTLNVGSLTSRSAHGYTVTGQTWSGAREFSYPSANAVRDALNSLYLRVTWDNESWPAVNAPLSAFFGVGAFGPGLNRSLLVGMDSDGQMYAYFPMPFAYGAKVQFVNLGVAASRPVDFEIRHKAIPSDLSKSGYFRTNYSEGGQSSGSDLVFLDISGVGHVVGVSQSTYGAPWFLEGDERALVDERRSPAIQGTGTEDFYNGGYYFDQGVFTRPTHGAVTKLAAGNTDVVNLSMFRLFLSDRIPFARAMRLSIEHGGDNDIAVGGSTLAYYYGRASEGLTLSDTLNVNDPASEGAHGYALTTQTWSGTRSYTFEGEFDDYVSTYSGRAHRGVSSFTMAIEPSNHGVTLRRLFDQTVKGQRANVYVDGTLVGTFYKAAGNDVHQWREEDLFIPEALTAGKSSINVAMRFVESELDWNEFRYQTYLLH